MPIPLSKIRDLLLPGLHYLGVNQRATYQYVSPSETEPKKKAPFNVGDFVTLKINNNPYKGTLLMGKAYMVQHVTTYSNDGDGATLEIIADNHTIGWFDAKHFKPHKSVPMAEAADEYQEILAMQELIEK